jgi:hypothetical protein
MANGIPQPDATAAEALRPREFDDSRGNPGAREHPEAEDSIYDFPTYDSPAVLPGPQGVSVVNRLKSQLRFHPAMISLPLLWRYRRRHGVLPRLFRQTTFSEKLLHRILFDRRPFLPVFGGKWEARRYVEMVTSDRSLLTDLVGIAANGREFRRIALPDRFIVKANHMSGRNHIHDGSKQLDVDWLAARIDDWCNNHRCRLEWGYDGTRRIVLVERLLDVDGQIPKDYKLFVFGGVVRYIQVDGDRFVTHKRDIFDRQWQRLDVRLGYPNSDVPPSRPVTLDRMIAVAEHISAGVDFVRVDLYDVAGQVKFGELTNYPGGLHDVFDPPEWDMHFGEAWQLPRKTGSLGFNLRTA